MVRRLLGEVLLPLKPPRNLGPISKNQDCGIAPILPLEAFKSGEMSRVKRAQVPGLRFIAYLAPFGLIATCEQSGSDVSPIACYSLRDWILN
jgi:hypothetical protein